MTAQQLESTYRSLLLEYPDLILYPIYDMLRPSSDKPLDHDDQAGCEISLESLMAQAFADTQNEFRPENPDIFQKDQGAAVGKESAFLDDMTRASLGFRATFVKTR